MIQEDVELEARLRRYGEALNREIRVSPLLHARIMDGAPAPAIRRSRSVWLQVAGAAAVLLIGVAIWAVISKVRADQIAASAPQVETTVPPEHATNVPLKGQFQLRFSARPSEPPVLSYKPADGSQEPAQWDGNTLVVNYSGLRPSRRYQVSLVVPFRTSFGDRHTLERSWSFTTEGPVRISSTVPASDEKDVARNGMIQVVFAKRPAADLVIRFQPDDGKLEAGQWKENAFLAAYTGLQPERSYKAILDVEFGSAAANVHQEWSFVTEPGSPPKGVQLIWVSTPAFPKEIQKSGLGFRLMGYDWAGKLRGTSYGDGASKQAPDGRALWLPGEGIVDTAGNLIQKADFLKTAQVWSDDSHHICEMRNATGGFPREEPAWLWVRTLGSPDRRLLQFGSFGGQSAPNVVACSFLTGRAVLTQHSVAWISEVQVVDLSNGRVLFRRQYSPNEVGSVTASRDGRFLAEMPQYDPSARVAATTIRRVSDGAVVARLEDESVAAFSWDGSTVMVSPSGGGSAAEFRLINWQTGKVLWTHPVPAEVQPDRSVFPYLAALPEPGGNGFVAGLGYWLDVPHPEGVWIIRGDGSAQQIGGPAHYPAF